MSSNGTTIIVPHLNEDPKILRKTVSTISNYFSSLIPPFEIIIADGGSKLESLLGIRKLSLRFQNVISIIDYPLIYPNKNIGIFNSVNLAKHEDILILDCDNESLSKMDLKKLKEKLSTYSMVVPNLERKGGRSNRLLGIPSLRLFFPEIYREIPYPFPGILGIKKSLLLKIVYDKNYCFDWGGEINLIVGGHFYSGGNITSIKMYKKDKKRDLSSILKDAYQIYRNNIYLSVIHKRFPRNLSEINKKIEESLTHYKKDVALLKWFIEENKIIELKNIETDEDFFHSDKPVEIYRKIENLYGKYKIYELYLLNLLVTKPLLQILFNTNVETKILEKNPKIIKNLNLKNISFLADIIILSLLRIFVLDKKSLPYSNLSGMLNHNPVKGISDFDSINLKKIEDSLIGGIRIDTLDKKNLIKLNKIIENKNSKIRNNKLRRFYLNSLIGKIGIQSLYFETVRLRQENIHLNNDFFTKLSILTTLAGYLKENNILLNDCPFEKERLEDFLSYVLNNKKFAPINFKLNIDFTNNKTTPASNTKHDYDCVILFSGGFDSTAAFLKSLDEGLKPLLLWIGFGQKNERSEYEMVKKTSKWINYPVSLVRLDLKDYINEGWKEWDYIIPARNFMFVCMAASFLSNSKKKDLKVFLSAHEEEIKETNTDKSKRFFNSCSELFTKFYETNITVETPFEKYSKAEIASYWNKKWIKKYKISPYYTITCYYGTNCGRCKACLKRNIALLVGGFNMDSDLKENPFEDKDNFIYEDLLNRFDEFSLKRKLELLIALDIMKEDLPIKTREEFSLLKDKYSKDIEPYKQHIKIVEIKK
ncbi:MAG: 7-cyano-7-deazaguanine synthase [Nanoarchaeota archaeon]|nr:7-cyano-7-deazaguanine synthase [Nanoarchaeota archaeon]